MRYLTGEYYREDSKLVRSMKAWQLTHLWTTERPSRRLRIVAYSPRRGVGWILTWQDTESEPLTGVIPEVLKTLQASRGKPQAPMTAEDEAEAKRKKERQEVWERYERREDERNIAQAIKESQQQLSEITESWGKSMVVERFFDDVEDRLAEATDEERQLLNERVKLARRMMGSIDPPEFIKNWRTPVER